ncbi:MAG: 30S ribosomal protein S20 [Oscillospiraceae bacterium]|nr:30S ribosomal protein S20 [Oscillospiraceae bacterium]
MPNIKSAKKRVKVIEKKTLQNTMIKSAIKTALKKFDSLIAANDKKEAASYHAEVVKMLDQALAKGVFHKNTVARKKSALAGKLNKLS